MKFNKIVLFFGLMIVNQLNCMDNQFNCMDDDDGARPLAPMPVDFAESESAREVLNAFSESCQAVLAIENFDGNLHREWSILKKLDAIAKCEDFGQIKIDLKFVIQRISEADSTYVCQDEYGNKIKLVNKNFCLPQFDCECCNLLHMVIIFLHGDTDQFDCFKRLISAGANVNAICHILKSEVSHYLSPLELVVYMCGNSDRSVQMARLLSALDASCSERYKEDLDKILPKKSKKDGGCSIV